MDNRPYNEKAVEIFKQYLPANIAELAIEAHKRSIEYNVNKPVDEKVNWAVSGACLQDALWASIDWFLNSKLGNFRALHEHTEGNTITATEEQLQEWVPAAYEVPATEVKGDEPNELPEVELHRMAELAAASNTEDTRDTTFRDAMRVHESARKNINRALYSFYKNYVNEKQAYWGDMLHDSGDGKPRLYTFEEFVSLPRVVQLLVMKINEKRRIESVDNIAEIHKQLAAIKQNIFQCDERNANRYGAMMRRVEAMHTEVKVKLASEGRDCTIARSNYRHLEGEIKQLREVVLERKRWSKPRIILLTCLTAFTMAAGAFIYSLFL